MNLGFAEKAILHQNRLTSRRLGTKPTIVQSGQTLDFFWLPVPNIFSCLFPFLFLGPFYSPTCCVLYSFWLLLTVGVNYGQRREMGPGSIMGIIGHFTTIFATKLITLVQFTTSECRWYLRIDWLWVSGVCDSLCIWRIVREIYRSWKIV